MFQVNEDLSIYVTRGDAMLLEIGAKTQTGEDFIFTVGDVIRIKVFEKKNCDEVVLQKDATITADTDTVQLFLDSEETKFGELINKPKDYWYEVEYNPDTEPQTIVGYDGDGAKIFRLFPEGADAGVT